MHRFASWLAGAAGWAAFAAAIVAWVPAGQNRPAPLPLTQLDERAPSADLDSRTLSLTLAQPVPVNELLVMLVRGTSLSVVPDPGVGGTFIGDLKNVTVRQAFDLVLPPFGLDYAVDGSIVRVFRREPDTRIFDLNYIATERTGSTNVGAAAPGASGASVASTTKTDIFADLTAGVRALLSDRGAFSIDRKAGLLHVTDLPDRLDKVAAYLEAVQDRVHRQARIDARVVEVELSDEKATGLDWDALAAQLGSSRTAGTAQPMPRTLAGLRVSDAGRLLTLLEAQGKVTVLATSRLLTMNNEPAIVRSDAVTLAVTAQIGGDSIVTLNVSPIVKAPTAESDLLARVPDGETLIVSGFTHSRETRERRAVGASGGWFGRGTVVTRKRVELLILLTPRIIAGVVAP